MMPVGGSIANKIPSPTNSFGQARKTVSIRRMIYLHFFVDLAAGEL
jgi:hypothetical protein